MRYSNVLRGLLTAALCLLSVKAHAYDKDSHQEIVELSWEVIRAASDPTLATRLATLYGVSAPAALNTVPAVCTTGGSANPCGKNVTTAEWSAFIATLSDTIRRLGSLPADVPGIWPTSVCPLPPTSSPTQTLSQVVQPVSPLFPGFGPIFSTDVETKCGVEPFWRHGGIYDFVQVPASLGEGAGFQGTVLGRMSKGADDRKQDTTLRISLQNTALANWLDQGVGTAVAAVAGPIVCFVSWLFGGPSCGDIIRSIRNGVRPIDTLAGLAPFDACDLPLVGDAPLLCDTQDESFIGFWHLINMNPAAATVNNPVFDDKGGLYYPHAGPAGVPGLADSVFAGLLDQLGGTINYDKSEGPKNYQILAGNDGHTDTITNRGETSWEAQNASLTMMEPLDNLAMFGWQRFLTPATRTAGALLWPLHALGDATVPHHVSNTAGFGHTAYENAVFRNFPTLLFRPCLSERSSSSADCPRTLESPLTGAPGALRRQAVLDQFEQSRRILSQAFKWRQFIVAKQVAPNGPTFVPVRDLVTALAQETRSASTFNTVVDAGGDACSVVNDLGPASVVAPTLCSEGPIAHYSTTTMIPILRDNVERSAGAKAAFLMSASFLLPAAAPPAPVCKALGQACTSTLLSGAASTTCCENTAQATGVNSTNERLERSTCPPTVFVLNPVLNAPNAGTCLPTACHECNALVAMTPSGACPARSTRTFLGETRAACRCDCSFPVD